MERIDGINLKRIEWCCTDMGTTLDSLAFDLGISTSAIDRLKAGEPSLTFNQLSKVANHFGRGVLFFLEEGDIRPENVHSAQFRTIAGQKPDLTPNIKRLIERVEKHKAIYLDLKEELTDIEFPAFNPPDIPKNNPQAAANLVRKWLQIGSSNSFETYRSALEAKGILVFRSMGYNGKWQIPKESPILGFALYDENCPTIVIKKLFVESRQSFTMMHELGHILLHKNSSIDDEIDFYARNGHEREANLFAANLLVPDEYLAEVLKTNIPDDVSEFDCWLNDFRKLLGVSADVIIIRLIEAGAINQNTYNEYCEWRSNQRLPDSEAAPRIYRYREPVHIFGERYVKTVIQSLSAKRITLTKASKYLDNLKVKDVHTLGSRYANS